MNYGKGVDTYRLLFSHFLHLEVKDMKESPAMTRPINYRIEDVVLVKDLKQAKLYASHGCHLADVLFSKTDNIFVFVFWKEETRELYKLWKRGELV